MNIRQLGANYLKNVFGWTTIRKLVVFSVDDYGNVRLDSNSAMINLKKSGFAFDSRFDKLDSLETREDLESLYEVLSSVKDKNGNFAIFTPYSLSCNINFEAMATIDYSQYVFELLPKTFEKVASRDSNAYSGAWSLWQEGIEKGLMKPQFHGREHFNLNIFKELLNSKCVNLLKVLKHDSHITIPEHNNYRNGWTAAYSFDKISEAENYLQNVADGLTSFNQVYGYESKAFTPPAQEFPLHLESNLSDFGIQFIDRPRMLKRHLGDGKYQVEKHNLGDGTDLIELVRNVVFEPTTSRVSDWVNFSFKQVEAAFLLKKPANISSHRVNYCGHIDQKNREIGLAALKQLLQKIVKRWPEVEFISADQLGEIILKSRKS